MLLCREGSCREVIELIVYDRRRSAHTGFLGIRSLAEGRCGRGERIVGRRRLDPLTQFRIAGGVGEDTVEEIDEDNPQENTEDCRPVGASDLPHIEEVILMRRRKQDKVSPYGHIPGKEHR